MFNEPSAEDLSQGFEDPVDAQSQPVSGPAAAKAFVKRESGGLDSDNLQGLPQPGQRPGTSNVKSQQPKG